MNMLGLQPIKNHLEGRPDKNMEMFIMDRTRQQIDGCDLNTNEIAVSGT